MFLSFYERLKTSLRGAKEEHRAGENRLGLNDRYRSYVRSIQAHSERDEQKAMSDAVGGSFEAMGVLMRSALIQYGLKPNHYVVDVGCGSGRLARPLSEYMVEGKYLGTDISPELIDYARRNVTRPSFRFMEVNGLVIPEQGAVADFVCFFSVLTHLRHEQSFLYLQEASRVLRIGGKILISFLDFSISSHWAVFEMMIQHHGDELRQYDQFMSVCAIKAWAGKLGLHVSAIVDGDKPSIPIPHQVVTDGGTVMNELGFLGQSICVLSKQ